jgi:Sigma-70, region 4
MSEVEHEHRWRRGRCRDCDASCDHPEPLDMEWREVRGRRIARWRCRQCGTLDLTSDRPLPLGRWVQAPGPNAPMPGGDHVEEAAPRVRIDADGRVLVEGDDGEPVAVDPVLWAKTGILRAIRESQDQEIGDAARSGGIGQWWSEEWQRRRRLGVERRAEWVREEMEREVEPPDWLRLLPPEVLTEKQREAVDLVYGRGLTTHEAARVMGRSRSVVRNRLKLARRKVEAWWGTWDPGEFWTPDEPASSADPVEEWARWVRSLQTPGR